MISVSIVHAFCNHEEMDFIVFNAESPDEAINTVQVFGHEEQHNAIRHLVDSATFTVHYTKYKELPPIIAGTHLYQ